MLASQRYMPIIPFGIIGVNIILAIFNVFWYNVFSFFEEVILMPVVKEIYISGEEIRKRRRALDITQDEFAEMLDCSQPNIARWESGKTRVSRRIAKEIQSLLDRLEAKIKIAA